MIPVVHHKNYVASLPKGHRFPMQKFGLLFELLHKDGIVNNRNRYEPEIIDNETLISVHDKNFVEDYKKGRLEKTALRKIGIPWSKEIVNRTLTALGGSLLTAKLALKFGIACNTAGGTHHAFKNYGSGFCIFNDIALVAKTLIKNETVEKILIVDLDVHQGDGTAAMLSDEPNIFTFSIHSKFNFPFNKQKSDLDIQLDDGVEDDEYLKIIDKYLPELIEQFNPDLVIFDAGVDTFKDDPLGRISLSLEGIYNRELKVINECVNRGIPVSCVIGGGYSKDLNELTFRHSLLHRAAKKVFEDFKL